MDRLAPERAGAKPDPHATAAAFLGQSRPAPGPRWRYRRVEDRPRCGISGVLHAHWPCTTPGPAWRRQTVATTGHRSGAPRRQGVEVMAMPQGVRRWSVTRDMTTEFDRLCYLFACLEEAPRDDAFFAHAIDDVQRSRKEHENVRGRPMN